MPGSSASVDGVRFTSLFGGSGVAEAECDRIGAAEPCEKVIEGELGPMLDRGLPCWDRGRIESLRIHELFDEKESRDVSVIVEAAKSPCRTDDCRRLVDLGGVTWELCGRW